MNKLIHFGASNPSSRTESGALLSVEIEKIMSLLRHRGLLLAECFDGFLVVCNPHLVAEFEEYMIDAGMQKIMVGSTLWSVRRSITLSVVEGRVLEALTPGAILVLHQKSENDGCISIAIPDDFDLRDICNAFGGSLSAYLWRGDGGITQLEEILRFLIQDGCNVSQIAVLEPPQYDVETEIKRATAVRIMGAGNIECVEQGDITFETVKEASDHTSVWEIEEWT